MKRYVGQDIREVILTSGQPISAIDMGGGVRAFQFMIGGATKTAVVSSMHTQISPSSASQWLSNTEISSSGSTISSSGCVVSYLTEWDERRSGWIVTGYRYPAQLVC
jgi:hypothetical protein